jgi:hypothetical protein
LGTARIIKMSDILIEVRKLLDIVNIDDIKNPKEKLFVMSMRNYIALGQAPTVKQIYWLRDIKDRQLNGG